MFLGFNYQLHQSEVLRKTTKSTSFSFYRVSDDNVQPNTTNTRPLIQDLYWWSLVLRVNIQCIEQHTIELKTALVRKLGLLYGGKTRSPIENKTNKISVKFM